MKSQHTWGKSSPNVQIEKSLAFIGREQEIGALFSLRALGPGTGKKTLASTSKVEATSTFSLLWFGFKVHVSEFLQLPIVIIFWGRLLDLKCVPSVFFWSWPAVVSAEISLRQASASAHWSCFFSMWIWNLNTVNCDLTRFLGRVSMGAGSCCLPLPSKVAGKIRGNCFLENWKNTRKKWYSVQSHGHLQILCSFLSSCSFARCFRLWILSDHFSRRTRIAS